MQYWNHIIQAAMLGTDKQQPGPGELTGDLQEALLVIASNNATDKEEKFLQTASLAFNYRQSGCVPLHKEGIDMPVAEAEERPYCNTAAAQALKDILEEDSTGLLKIWLQCCDEKQQIAPPALLPSLLNKAAAQKPLRAMVQQCTGRRGAWLGRFNKDWQFSAGLSLEELWQTGSSEQRKQALQQLRLTDAVKAREWLQQTWAQENAAGKTELLKILHTGLSEQDTEWLESLGGEKSQKVKEEVLNLLKHIPSSAIVKQYEQVLQQAVVMKKEKGLLGLSSKTALHVQLPPAIDEAVFKTGIEKLSNRKEFTDDEFIVYQLMQNVPPSFWEKQLGATAEEIISLFQKDEPTKKFLTALVIALVKFTDQRWALAFMQYAKTFYLDIIPLIPVAQQEYYSNKFFAGNEESITHYALQRDTEWGLELTKNIFRHAAKTPYQYNRSFFNQQIHLIPVQSVGELEKCTPPEEYQRANWSSNSDYIMKLVTLKIQTIKAFR